MKNLLYINVAFLSIIFLMGCNPKNNTKILSQADSLLESRPDSALKLLDLIDVTNGLSEAEWMQLSWIRAEAHYRRGMAMTEDTLLRRAVKYYRENKDSDKILGSYLLEAKYLKWNNEDSIALAVLNNGLNQALALKDTLKIINFYEDITAINYQHGKHAEVVNLINKILQYSDKVPDRDCHHIIYTKGVALALTGDDSFSGYFEQSIDMALAKGDTLVASHYMRNYSDALAYDGQYTKSNEIVREVLRLVPRYNDSSAFQMTLAQNFINLHQLDSARKYWDLAWINEQKLQAAGVKNLARRSFLAQLKSVLDYTGHSPVEVVTFTRFGDSIMNEMKDQQNTITQQLETRNKLQQQNYELIINRQKTKLRLIIVSFLLIAAGIGVYIYMRNRYKRLAEAEERIDVLTRLLNDAQKASDDSPQGDDDAFFKKILLQQLGIIRLVANTPTSQNQKLLKLISGISNKEIPVDGLLVWVDLYPIIDKLYNDFYTRLTDKFGSALSDKEVQICCLLCANFSTKEIGVITQQTDATIYVRKSSIRKKIGAGEKQDIVDYINSI